MRTIGIAVTMLLLPALALAQVPQRVGYQGRLLKADGTPESGTVQIAFALFAGATGGTSSWNETQTVALTDGYYAIQLGDVTALPASVFDGTDRWLELSIAGTALTPRQRVGSVPYAMACRNLNGGTVNASSIVVNGQSVTDINGKVDWTQMKSCTTAGDTLQWTAGGWACQPMLASIFVSAPLTGNGTAATPVSMPEASASTNGYLAGADFAAFDSKVGSVSATPPLLSSGGATPDISMPQAGAGADGFLSAGDWSAFDAKRSNGGRNIIDWMPLLSRWTNTGGTPATIALNSTDTLEGDASVDLTVNTGATGSENVYGDYIRIDTSYRYRGEISAKLITGAGTFFAGYIAYDANKAVLGGNGGTYGYFIANGVTLTNSWRRLAGIIQGEGTLLTQFPVGTRFIRPLIITNYQNIGETRVSSFEIYRVQTSRSIPHASGVGPGDTTCDVDAACGPTPLATRRVVFNKTDSDTSLRLAYFDTMRSYGVSGVRGCRWSIYVDGAACPSGNVSGVVYGAPGTDPHHPHAIVGYCDGVAAGPHTVQVYVANVAGYSARCYTGWPGDVAWTLEADEVR